MKKFPYRKGYKKATNTNFSKSLHGLSFVKKTIMLDNNKLKGVTCFELEKSSAGYAELKLKMIVRVKDLDY